MTGWEFDAKLERQPLCVRRVQAMQAGLSQAGSTWYMLRLSNMSTVTREWVALHSVRDLKFQDILLSAKTSATRRTSKLLIPQVIALEDMSTMSCKATHIVPLD